MSPIGLNGTLANSMTWLPLLLTAIERARKHSFLSCLLLATAAYTMSVLAGSGQGFTYTGALAFAYAIFLTTLPSLSKNEHQLSSTRWERLKPLAVFAGAMTLTIGVASFQILETMNAAKLSVRPKLRYDQFSEGSFPFSLAWMSWIEPIYHRGDVTTYTAPFALMLGILAAAIAIWRRGNKRPILFWLWAAVIAWILIMGSHTPFNRMVYNIPFIKLFRMPSRHTFEWTFAVSILAAYGWDEFAALIAGWKPRISIRWEWVNIALAIVCLLLSVLAGWKLSAVITSEPHFDPAIGNLDYPYLKWKAIFTLSIILTIWRCNCIVKRPWRVAMAAMIVALACFVEPFLELKQWAMPTSLTADHFTSVAATTPLLQQYPPEQNRVYTPVNPFAESHLYRRKVDAVDYTAVTGLQDISGYEPLTLERYSRALRGLPWEHVDRTPWTLPDQALFDPRSHVLDILNTTLVTTYSSFIPKSEELVDKDGISFIAANTPSDAEQHLQLSLNNERFECNTLALVTTLGNASDFIDGTPVAEVFIHSIDGQVIKRHLRAGIDTAELAYERADIRPSVRHALAPIYDSYAGDASNTYQAHRFLSRLHLGQQTCVDSIEIVKLVQTVELKLWKASLYNTISRRSIPLPTAASERWQYVYQHDGAVILRNLRALPRAWLVPETEVLDKKEVLRRIRGESEAPFDPRRTALFEFDAIKPPTLSGKPLAADAYARVVTYEPNRLVIETNADQQAALVVSEIHYPGWVATIDGAKAPIYQTNFLLRGVAVPPGKHRVEMCYLAPGARKGAIISFITLSLIAAITFNPKLRKRLKSKGGKPGSALSVAEETELN